MRDCFSNGFADAFVNELSVIASVSMEEIVEENCYCVIVKRRLAEVTSSCTSAAKTRPSGIVTIVTPSI